MLATTLLFSLLLACSVSASPLTSIADFATELLAGLQAQGLSQSTAVLQANQAAFQPFLQKVFESQNSTSWTFYAPTDAAWAKVPTGSAPNPVETLSLHFAGEPLTNYITPNYTVQATLEASPVLPANGTQPVVIVTAEAGSVVIRGSSYNATALNPGARYGSIAIVPVDTVLSQPPPLRAVLGQDLVPRAVNSTINTNFTLFSQFLDSFGYLDRLANVTGLTVFAPTDEAMTKAAASLARLSRNDQEVVAKNHIFQGQVLYSPVLAGSSQLSSSSGGRLSWCRQCGNGTSELGLSMLVVATNISAEVLRTDVIIQNGVVHLLDAVLLNTKNQTRTANQAPSGARSGSATPSAPSATATFGGGTSDAPASLKGGTLAGVLFSAIAATTLVLL